MKKTQLARTTEEVQRIYSSSRDSKRRRSSPRVEFVIDIILKGELIIQIVVVEEDAKISHLKEIVKKHIGEQPFELEFRGQRLTESRSRENIVEERIDDYDAVIEVLGGDTIDWSSLTKRMKTEDPKLSTAFINRILSEYLRFLELKIVLSDFDASIISPSALVDKMWHAHILDTRHYKDMCERALQGHMQTFIHHNPDGGDDIAGRRNRIAATRATYKARYGMECPSDIWWTEQEVRLFGSAEVPQRLVKLAAKINVVKTKVLIPNTLSYYGIAAARNTRITVLEGELFTVNMKTMTGRTYVFKVMGVDSVGHLKQMVQDSEGIPPDQQRLIFEGRQLEDKELLVLIRSKTISLCIWF